MKNSKKQNLEAKGWKVGSAEELLGLSQEESEFIRMKLALAHSLKMKRIHQDYSQSDFAKKIHSSQSRVAKMEQGDASVSIDLLIHSLFMLGVTRQELAKIISKPLSKN